MSLQITITISDAEMEFFAYWEKQYLTDEHPHSNEDILHDMLAALKEAEDEEA